VLIQRPTRLLLAACVGLFAACDTAPTDVDQTSSQEVQFANNTSSDARLALVGERIFNDRNLSLNRNQSCSSCHDAAWGFTSPNTAINAGGSVLPGTFSDRFGKRKPPSAAYATPSPVLHFDAADEVWIGGNFWDGRATGQRLGSPAAEQALAPFVSAVEQSLPDLACVVFRVREANYGGLFTSVWGRRVHDINFPSNTDELCTHENITVPLSAADRALAVAEYDHVVLSIAAFENSPAVNQFSSKYDAYLAGKAQLTALETEGLALYVGKGNCAACHPNDGERALFTDFTYDNIGVPGNPANPALLANALFSDLGLGGFLGDSDQDGKQKVPTLRNLNKRGIPGGAKAFMHNGVFKTLEHVVHFYNTRDVLPACESTANPQFGVNCWPRAEVLTNVNVDELGNLGLTPAEETALVAYLKTLSDGYK
jgi:cytochrome c peroxidase